MRLITISLDPSRVRRQRRVYPTLEVFEASGGCTSLDYRDMCIPETYRRLALWALAEKLDRDDIVMQDDVWGPNGPGFEGYNLSFDTPLLVYGNTEASGLIVPKMFSAMGWIWQMLSEVWTGEGRISPAWRPIVDEYGMVLNETRQI